MFGEFTFAVGGQLLRIRTNRFVTPPNDSADIGLISIPSEAAKTINDTGGVFLDAEMIDEVEKADGLDDLNTFANCYFAVGFPASRARSQIRHREKKIHLRTFSVRLTLAPTVDYPDGFSKDEHLLLDYAADEVLLGGQPVNPPKVQGMSGGGIFRFRRRRPETTKLVGILIEHHKAARVMVGTRVAVVAALAREVITRHPNTFL